MLLMVITILSLNSGVIEGPINQLSESAFIDIGNGVSTRMVDLYVLAPVAPSQGNITTHFDIPDEVAGREYFVTVLPDDSGDPQIVVHRGSIERKVSLSGINSTLGVGGETTGHGLNNIIYNSS